MPWAIGGKTQHSNSNVHIWKTKVGIYGEVGCGDLKPPRILPTKWERGDICGYWASRLEAPETRGADRRLSDGSLNRGRDIPISEPNRASANFPS
jgi:hypothetical protein